MDDTAFEIVQLSESDVDRVVKFFEKQKDFRNPILSTDSITLALKYENILICSVKKYFSNHTSYCEMVIIMPDSLLTAKTFSEISTGKRGICESTGDSRIDEILSEAVICLPLYEETTFAWFISQTCGESNDKEWQEHGEKYEKLRLELIHYEFAMRKKYKLIK
ncbi:MAG: hypothetical protein IJ642_07125 [Oscillospiraceae bacterium]|nr:hypothetical protein [Oscillospiraceae bacterium]